MKKVLFVGLVVLSSCGSASTEEVICEDSTSVKVDTIKAVDSVKVVDSVKSK